LLEEEAKTLAYEEPTEPLNADLVHGGVVDFELHRPAAVTLQYYRSGEELFFHGHLSSHVIGHCARCLEEYGFDLDKDFALVLLPRPKSVGTDEEEIGKDEVDVAYYDADLVDIAPMVLEQLILALPTRPLCDDDCKGLCPQCGANLNNNPCSCTVPTGDLRLAILKKIKVSH